MDVRILLILFFLVSCLPQSKVSRGQLSEDTGTTGGSNGGSTTQSDTTWNYLGQLTKSITTNVSNLNVAYITGSYVEKFLNTGSSFSYDYCFISRYSVNGVTKEMRSRIIPISYYDFIKKRNVRLMRVDFPDVTNSTSICGSDPLLVLDANGNHVTDTNTYTVIHDPAQICPTCTSIQASIKNSIFVVDSTTGDLKELSTAQIDIRAMSLQVDPNNNGNSNVGSCTNTSCSASGYDCCLENQCVNDGAVRPSAISQYPSHYQAAEIEKQTNPMAYLNYPHIYYICGTSIPTTSGGSGGGSTGGSSGGGGGGYTQAFEQLKKDFYCIKNLKDNKVSETFHMDLFTSPTPFPHITTSGRECYTTSMNADTMYYHEVVKRLYQTCGCAKTTLLEMVNSCPAYEYVATTTDLQGVPTQIDCYTPSPGGQGVPSNQSVSVSSRSAPHRFFDTTGTERDISSGSTTYAQEGDAFEYLDEEKLLPVQSDFGMNSILGQMSVTLDQALPAKVVNVQLDQVYTLSTISGYYTPCPTCSKDFWLSSFTAFPSTSYGVGLQAIGHTTARDEFSTNLTGGNYEDTIFGRACWIPPTMIPFSHSAYSSVQSQRLARIKTQAALFANGYQRDWFGFNKGAMIGSFDGVTWFAIGKGRIVKATSTKLFLAINAPHADLASPGLHVVNVQEYDGFTQAAQVDYDPDLSLSHAYQNEAGNCQANHMCETDTDCITRLGWEYMCADVRDVKTQWPSFDSSGNEVANTETAVTIDQILQQKKFPTSSTKRCVYRGAGAPCIVNTTSITDNNLKKTVSCAPNFYCANVNAGSVHNGKIARYGANVEDIPVTRNHYFGKDANVLGRPLHYIAAGSGGVSFTSDIQTNIRENMTQNIALGSTQSGICQPGKVLPTLANQTSAWSPLVQHQSRDTSGRADFISQIASCNPTLYSAYRYSSCPVIGADGNYDMYSSSTWTTDHVAKSRAQNSCGLDSLLNGTSLSTNADSMWSYSPFKAVESKTLSSTTVFEPTLARDACLRRAGQVCHTDLDCGPNKLHAEQTDFFSNNYFGNAAEKQYYSENLICGQADPKPLPSETLAFMNYKMNLNRCCREQGLDLTTYTSDVPADGKVRPVASTDYIAETWDLRSWLLPGTEPSNSRRYSRLASVEGLTLPESVTGSTTKPPLSAYQNSSAVGGYQRLGVRRNSSVGNFGATGINVMTPYQWSTLGDANSNTCCGGGWIRKFADGTTDWTKRNRVYMDVQNFKCINSRTPLLTNPGDFASLYNNSVTDVTNLVNQDIGYYCKNALNQNSSCAQYTITNSLTDTPPTTVGALFQVGSFFQTYGLDFVTAYDTYFYPNSADNDPAIIIDNTNSNTDARRNINIRVPSFITRSWDTIINNNPIGDCWGTPLGSAWVGMYNIDDPTEPVVCCRKMANLNDIISPINDGSSGGGVCTNATTGGEACCYSYDSSTRNLKVVPNFDHVLYGPSATTRKLGVRLQNALTAGSYSGLVTRTIPGSNAYYLKRLGLFELSGIPQITYPPLACNDNSARLIPGLYGVDNLSDFKSASFSFNIDGADTINSYRTNHHGLDHDPVFSANDFKCCSPLGKLVTTTNKCCSGYGIANGSKFNCALPSGTDLMVYFNRFVSNEGRGDTQPGGGLVDADFDTITGEPKLTSAVNQKISALGVAYCESAKVRQGGAFGAFKLEPVGPDTSPTDTKYGIVDSSQDYGTVSNGGQTVAVGYQAFMNGYRWNHHLYCDD